jgi:hypothetical protein
MIEPDTDTGTRAILPVQYEAFLPLRALDTRPGHTEFGVVTIHGLVGEHSKARGGNTPPSSSRPLIVRQDVIEVVPKSDTVNTHTKPTWLIQDDHAFFFHLISP